MTVRPMLVELLLVPILASFPQATLSRAEITITVDGAGASVTATYRLTAVTSPVRFSAIRLWGQRLRLFPAGTAMSDSAPDTLPGLVRLDVAANGADLADLELHYYVEGTLRRIPLFVPEAPAAPPGTRIRITVVGVPPERLSATRFPRFRVGEEGRLHAAPDHLPAFVAVMTEEGAAPVPRVAEWLVLMVAVIGTAAWMLRLRANRPRPQKAV